MKRTLWMVLILFLNFAAMPIPAFAGVDYNIEISQKLGRGLLNALSSPLELPCTIRDDVKDRGGVGIVTGLFRGIAFFARRLLVGVDEVVTFVIPMEETLPPVCTKKPAAQIQR